jgi:LemA protein
MIFKMNVKPNFTVADEGAVSTPPKVDFGKPAAPVTPAPGAGGSPPATGTPAPTPPPATPKS